MTALRDPAAPSARSGTTPGTVLRLTGVTREHGGREVWAPVDLTVAAGTLSLVSGPNGAGKTTLLRVAAGLLRPSRGARQCSGRALYVRGGGGLRSAQTVQEAVGTSAALVGRRSAAPEALRLLGLEGLAQRRVGSLSAGERVRAALAAAVACGPALLCLDEPTAALDDRALADLAGVLGRLRADGAAILLATHQPDALPLVPDARLVVAGGRVVQS